MDPTGAAYGFPGDNMDEMIIDEEAADAESDAEGGESEEDPYTNWDQIYGVVTNATPDIGRWGRHFQLYGGGPEGGVVRLHSHPDPAMVPGWYKWHRDWFREAVHTPIIGRLAYININDSRLINIVPHDYTLGDEEEWFDLVLNAEDEATPDPTEEGEEEAEEEAFEWAPQLTREVVQENTGELTDTEWEQVKEYLENFMENAIEELNNMMVNFVNELRAPVMVPDAEDEDRQATDDTGAATTTPGDHPDDVAVVQNTTRQADEVAYDDGTQDIESSDAESHAEFIGHFVA